MDLTFDFGPYNDTPISYQHLIVLRREDGKHPTMIGPVLPHEKKTQSTYSLFGGTLKSLETEESNGFRDQMIHLHKNIDTNFVSMDIIGESKQSIKDNIFGRKIGSIFGSGLSEAGSAEQCIGLFESQEEK